MTKSKKFYSTKVESTEPDCEACGLSAVCKSPKLKFIGKGKKNVLIIGSQPTSREDLKGELGYGDEAVFLESALEEIGIDFYEDCFYTVVCGCRPPRDRRPGTAELKACRKRLDRIIERLEPISIITLGDIPTNAIIGNRIKGRLTGTPMKDFYGTCIKDQEVGKWVIPTWSIQEMLSTKTYEDSDYVSKPLYQRDVAWYRMWKQHMAQALGKEPFPIIDYAAKCQTTEDIDVAIDWLCEALDWSEIAFDYESDGLKSHRKGHRIYSVSISNGEVSRAFPFFDDATFRKMYQKVMTSGKKLIAHNASFEWQWTKNLLGYWPTEMYWDTMLSMHVVNNNAPTGLKYVTYITTGVVGYDSESDFWLQGTKEEEEKYGNNAFNRIFEAPKADILKYNALDSLFTFEIYKDHKASIGEFQMEGFRFLMESCLTLAKVSQNGFILNTKGLEDAKKILAEKVKEAEQAIIDSEEVALWDKPDEPFNLGSAPQLSHLLYDILKLKPPFLTDGGKPSVNAEALEKLNCPLVKKILTLRKLEKLYGTYVHQYEVEVVDGVIHPQFFLNSVVSYRSSCGNVNVQNVPKRDPEAKKLVTSLIVPRPGRQLVGMDYKAVEVAVNACYSRDKNLLAYVNDPSKDMHRDSSMDVFMLEASEVTKSIRSGIKSAYVFSNFFGSYYKLTAPSCWELAIENNLLDHLKSKGIDTFSKFEQRVKEAEDIMWNKRFAGHSKWRKGRWEEYQKKGYLDSYDGFRFYGPMSRNLSFNLGGQCSAYHILQRTMNKMQKYIEDHKLESLLLFQVHDSLYYDAVPSEIEELRYWTWYYGTQEVKEAWPWIVVNLQIEMETGPVGANWSELKDVGYLDGKGYDIPRE